ncbi:unnamed protein product [Echinostoma caproni]|uniref:Ig-like domain-containing protein n=1 Tax=Echinostoma caproni TaxID=27848 RepID=A0A182ZZK1_9TREM|nr:unnamed protein product [Echinostoma caproni]
MKIRYTGKPDGHELNRGTILTSSRCLVLAPVPLVLICALVRICSQKRHLDLAEEGDLGRWRDSATCPNVAVLVDGAGLGDHPSKRIKLAKVFWTGRRQRRGPQYGPVRTLSSVPEVDERELELHSSLNLPSNTEWVQSNADLRNTTTVDGDDQETPGRTTNSGSPKLIKSNLMPSPNPKGRLAKSHSLTPLQEIGGFALYSNPVEPMIEITRTRRRTRDDPESQETAERRRRFLCWSVLTNPGSSSSTSSRSSSSSSSCSNCREAGKSTILRSRSCNDLSNIWSPGPPEFVELQTLNVKKELVFKTANQNGTQSCALKNACPLLNSPGSGWSYSNLRDSDDRPTENSTEIEFPKHTDSPSQTTHAFRVVAQLSNPPQSSEPQSAGGPTELTVESSHEPKELSVVQEWIEQSTEPSVNFESHRTDPVDTRSGSRDRLLLLHRAQSPANDED